MFQRWNEINYQLFFCNVSLFESIYKNTINFKRYHKLNNVYIYYVINLFYTFYAYLNLNLNLKTLLYISIKCIRLKEHLHITNTFFFKLVCLSTKKINHFKAFSSSFSFKKYNNVLIDHLRF